MNLKLTLQLFRNMGIRYISYRSWHEFEKKSGILKRKHPVNLKIQTQVALSEWKTIARDSPISAKQSLGIKKNRSEVLKTKAESILSGQILFFNAEWLTLGKDYNWITNPSNGYVYDVKKHWSEIPDLSKEAGDIKYVWEKSRFSWLLPLLKYDYHFERDLSEFVFSEIESWIDHNPINQGPNWRCSQEISLRIFNWYFALCYYIESSALTEFRWRKIVDVIYASLHHVYHHIDFSRIAVRNNHTITETLFLALSDILFPFIPETKLWARKGRTWFEKEVAYQVYEDGAFLQFSMNYHRVVVQLLSVGLSIAERSNRPFSEVVYDRAYRSVEFLYQCLQEENGWLPNYGSNDGALFFPWSDTDYRDYRPQLNTLHYFLTGEHLFEGECLKEEIDWYGIQISTVASYKKIERYYGIKEYSIGGYVIIRDTNTFTFMRCGSHKDRPAQADNLHIDIWVNGVNVLRDSGTYKYNTSSDLINYFMGTASHNTVLVNGESQMLKGSRFIWYYWTQREDSYIRDTEGAYAFKGTVSAYSFLNAQARLIRSVTKIKGELKWIVTDEVIGLDGFHKQQIWHMDGQPIEFLAKENNRVLNEEGLMSYKSDYYGVMEKGRGIGFTFKQKIETEIIFNE